MLGRRSKVPKNLDLKTSNTAPRKTQKPKLTISTKTRQRAVTSKTVETSTKYLYRYFFDSKPDLNSVAFGHIPGLTIPASFKADNHNDRSSVSSTGEKTPSVDGWIWQVETENLLPPEVCEKLKNREYFAGKVCVAGEGEWKDAYYYPSWEVRKKLMGVTETPASAKKVDVAIALAQTPNTGRTEHAESVKKDDGGARKMSLCVETPKTGKLRTPLSALQNARSPMRSPMATTPILSVH